MFKIFCLPFAGGNKYSYLRYQQLAPANLTLVPLEYPGHGARSHEPLLTDLDALANDLYRQVKDSLGYTPYGIFGHSMGGLLAWLLAKKIRDNRHPPPVHLFITGTQGPSSTTLREKKRYLLGKKAFQEHLAGFDDNFRELFLNQELFDYFEPVLRADFMACETFSYKAAPPLDIPFTVLYGSGEPITPEEANRWQQETTCTIDCRVMNGRHFFIFDHAGLITDLMEDKLMACNTISDKT